MFLRCRLVHMYIQIVHLINHSSLVCGQEVEFLADSGATHSVLCSDSLFPQAVLSEKFTHSGFASGTVQRENFTVAPSCVEGQGQKFRHGSLWSDLCPVNLLARDLMWKLNINCISCHDVITLTQSNCDHMMVKYCPVILAFAYEWKLGGGSLVEELAAACLQKAHSPSSYIRLDKHAQHVELCSILNILKQVRYPNKEEFPHLE